MRILYWLHIAFMVLAAVFLFRAVIIGYSRKPEWFPLHKKSAIPGVLSAILGGTVILAFKTVMDYPHFKSNHALIGAGALFFLILTPLLGIWIAKGPAGIRPVHRLSGRTAILGLTVAACLGFYKLYQKYFAG